MTTSEKINAMAEAFKTAKAAGEAAFTSDDGGTSNLDSPAFRVARISKKSVEAAAALAGVSVSDFEWFGGRRWFWLGGFLKGQGNCRSRMSHAATKALEAAASTFEGFEMSVCEYCQAD